MLRPRLIPSLLVMSGALVKTTKFKSPKYVGDPLNAIRIFNELKCDELCLFDISATSGNNPIDFSLLERLARLSNMPLCYGGGVKCIGDARRIINLGIEKVSISSSFLTSPDLAHTLSSEFGSQSVVVTLDVMKNRFTNSYSVYTHNALRKSRYSLLSAVESINSSSVGEVIINAIHRDGTCSGYDIDLIASVRSNTSLPIVSLGGAANLDDPRQIYEMFPAVAAAAGSLFVFQGKYRSVLINYPTAAQKIAIYPEL